MTPPPSLRRGHVLYVHMKQSFHCIARLKILSKFDLMVYSEFPSTGSRYSSVGFFFLSRVHLHTCENSGVA